MKNLKLKQARKWRSPDSLEMCNEDFATEKFNTKDFGMFLNVLIAIVLGGFFTLVAILKY